MGLFELDIDEKPKNDIANPIETSTSRKFHRVFKERESQQEFNSPEEKFEVEVLYAIKKNFLTCISLALPRIGSDERRNYGITLPLDEHFRRT